MKAHNSRLLISIVIFLAVSGLIRPRRRRNLHI